MPAQEKTRLGGREQQPPTPRTVTRSLPLGEPKTSQQQPSPKHRHRGVVVGIADPRVDNANRQARVDEACGEAHASRCEQAARPVDGDHGQGAADWARPRGHLFEAPGIRRQGSGDASQHKIEERGPRDRGSAGVVDIGIEKQNGREVDEGVERPAQVVLGVGRRENDLIAHKNEFETQRTDCQGENHQEPETQTHPDQPPARVLPRLHCSPRRHLALMD